MSMDFDQWWKDVGLMQSLVQGDMKANAWAAWRASRRETAEECARVVESTGITMDLDPYRIESSLRTLGSEVPKCYATAIRALSAPSVPGEGVGE